MIEIKHLDKAYGEKEVYRDFSFSFRENTVTAILGESGCGKTTLLNILAGLTPYQAGEVPDLTPLSFIFQTDRLLPHLSVRDNLWFVTGKRELDDDLRRAGLYEARDSYIKDISGGQRRRVSILRAFLYPAKTILMDEPFLNIDLKLKRELMDFYLSYYEGGKRTALFVTHDPDEALYLSARVVVLKAGRIVFDAENPKNKPLPREALTNALING
ncbi:MAG: ATP-binding cassette domain-containing protein [Clostridiales bacterium]|jgi:NitT/TauT family transport system ATP-binding protein|nr:ATP-binding cassette domain-containing protein [Clostridiales bacterium]